MKITTFGLIVFGIIGYLVYQLYQASLASSQYQYQLEQAQQAVVDDSNLWLTVPGSVNLGIKNATGLIQTLSNLFASTPSNN